jgi:hypothetical protein
MERLREWAKQGFNRAKNGKLFSSASARIYLFLIFFNLTGSVGPFLSAKYFGEFKSSLKRLGRRTFTGQRNYLSKGATQDI